MIHSERNVASLCSMTRKLCHPGPSMWQGSVFEGGWNLGNSELSRHCVRHACLRPAPDTETPQRIYHFTVLPFCGAPWQKTCRAWHRDTTVTAWLDTRAFSHLLTGTWVCCRVLLLLFALAALASRSSALGSLVLRSLPLQGEANLCHVPTLVGLIQKSRFHLYPFVWNAS